MWRHITRHAIKFSRQNVNNQLQCEFELDNQFKSYEYEC